MTAGFQQKIVGLEALQAAVAQAREAGKSVVQCHGCFDIVHPGHIRYLEFARRQGDLLIVSLTGDSDIDKGSARPYIPQELRAENLAALMFVDFVHIHPYPTAEGLLDQVRPDIYVKGREYEGSDDPGFLSEKTIVERYGGKMIFSSGEIVFSSTALIEALPASRNVESHRLSLLCGRHDVSQESLTETLDRFADLNVLVVGDTIIDRYVVCDALGVASESPMMNLVQRDERSFVGGAAIVARHVAALGGHAFLLSAGAADDSTKLVSKVLESEGVDAHLIPARASIAEKTRFLVDDTKILKVDRAERQPLDSLAERRAATILEQQSKVADAVIFCDFGYGMITSGLLRRSLPSLRQNVRILAADASGQRANLLDFHNVDLLCPTEREVRATLHDFDSGLSAVAWNLMAQTQARHLLVTLDKRGMVSFERQGQQRGTAQWSGRLKSEQLPAVVEFAVDRLGCGDALLTAATLALACGADLIRSAYLGNLAAGIEVATMGNVPVDIDSLRRSITHRPELKLQGDVAQPVGTAPQVQHV